MKPGTPRTTSADLRGVAWRVQGIAALLAGFRADEFALTAQEAYGLGGLIAELGDQVEAAARDMEALEMRSPVRTRS
jgi:hypothetical protein